MRTTTLEDRLRQRLGDALLTQEPLRHHTTMRIGGAADFYFAARNPHQLVEALKAAREFALPLFLLGGGSNLLVSDDGFRGLVLRNAIEEIEFDGTAAQVGCGTDFLELIYACRDRDLAGLEFAAGIPGSVGGALYGNAGCYGQDIGSFTIECTVASLDPSTRATSPVESPSRSRNTRAARSFSGSIRRLRSSARRRSASAVSRCGSGSDVASSGISSIPAAAGSKTWYKSA